MSSTLCFGGHLRERSRKRERERLRKKKSKPDGMLEYSKMYNP